jgi:hypothetical protein
MHHFSAANAPWRSLDSLLQRGVWWRATTPAPLLPFLIGQLGLGEAYVRDRIETIFIDGMVVDDLDRSVVRDGSTVTLSAAMPGLVGATLRRGGYYKAMRSGISWSTLGDDGLPEETGPGLVRVKLFNLILREVGPGLLAEGVLVDAPVATAALGDLVAEPSAEDVGGRILLIVDRPQTGPED